MEKSILDFKYLNNRFNGKTCINIKGCWARKNSAKEFKYALLELSKDGKKEESILMILTADECDMIASQLQTFSRVIRNKEGFL